MALAYFFKAGGSLEPQGEQLCERYSVVRDWCEQAAQWYGTTVTDLMSMKVSTRERLALSLLRNIVISLGVTDVLADIGIHPRAVAGFCGGIMPAAVTAGCVEREDLIRLVSRLGQVAGTYQGDDDSTAAVAQLGFPAATPESHIRWFYGDEWPEVHLASDSGLIADGSYRVITVTGYAEDLERLATHMPRKEHIKIYATYGITHSPAYMPVRRFIEPHVRAITFREPTLPLFDGFGPEAITTVDRVIESFVRCYTDPVWLDHVRTGLRGVGTRLTIAPGPGSPQQLAFLQWPFEVMEVQVPEDVERATSTVYDLAVLP